MGYILPINNYQSQQYSNRTSNRANSPFMLPPVFKTTIIRKINDSNRENTEFDQMKEFNIPSNSHNKSRTKPKVNYELISVITGKGINFNESI
ncbi:hypothetical protein [Bacillus suaedaesalsae]|uniref:Uncharacterized protein n=1 Tax=Bacillus suaedaesalsae TaxID=2810349 RepID=A0ABS2DI58_9BACI|nr:hypothetical protein [Bacillus suaedaesalsae]MBM6618182.1 hypothetical protein [Bacillus suaedaesalsae]